MPIELKELVKYRYISKFYLEGVKDHKVEVFEGISREDAKIEIGKKYSNLAKIEYCNFIYNPNKPSPIGYICE